MDTASKNIMGRSLLSLIRAAETLEDRIYQTRRLQALGLNRLTVEMTDEIAKTEDLIQVSKGSSLFSD